MTFPHRIFRLIRLIPVLFAGLFLAIACAPSTLTSPLKPASPIATPTPTISVLSFPAVPTLTFKVLNTYPHDRMAFTEGLVIADGVLI